MGGFPDTETIPRPSPLQAQGLVIALDMCQICHSAQEGAGVRRGKNTQRSQPCLCLDASELLPLLAGSWETLTQGNFANGFADRSVSCCPARREPLGFSQPQPG